ncbi:GNAT family N-acetyltransferase [Tenacibaculum sp. SG-28]|uniref:GNAT family N-acetyltransferase n=1 Tax=Tenacibaculum sp. SG-28 TaxID=754426 RepID=UPI000CF46826|nr:GNAT family N-acetyltransferase [Tenacibaculum sp. SG-28]PQJ23182.1 GNAT family N-acetyltransferase [Tenacibaculum sp. SG-28]
MENITNKVIITAFSKEYANEFYTLNIAWLRQYFYVEPFDEEVLRNPETYIVNKGGHVFFAKVDGQIVGTVALMPKDGTFELTKMAVAKTLRGKKIGQHLMQYCINFAKANAFKNLILYSNTILENAIYIYRKYGFKEIKVEENCPYERCNIKMILNLD